MFDFGPFRLFVADESEPEQMSLFDAGFQADAVKRAKKKKINDALKKVQEKYGEDIVIRGLRRKD